MKSSKEINPDSHFFSSDVIWEKIYSDGYAFLHDPYVCTMSHDPVALSEHLFGKRPIRFQKTIIQPDLSGNQISLPKTKHEGVLHNDCMQYGMPAHMQVMLCEKQASSGGETYILDLWPVIDKIKLENTSLFTKLFTVLRRMKPYYQSRFSLTVSMCRGNLICFHPGQATDDPVGIELQSYIDSSEVIKFRCAPGDVYINNNHRCLHGRESFVDENRRFVRILYWFLEPLPAPESFRKFASIGTTNLKEKMQCDSFWVEQHLGIEAPELSVDLELQLSNAVAALSNPTDCNLWGESNFRRVRVQEAVLSALWQVLNEPDFVNEEIINKTSSLL